MGFRTIVITSRSHCSLENNYIVIRNDKVTMVHLSETDLIIADTPAISITGALAVALARSGIAFLLCNEKHMPAAVTLPLYSNFSTSGKLREQISWKKERCDMIWQEIVRQKIASEIHVLNRFSRNKEQLETYRDEILPGDRSNREGLSARYYFTSLFGDDFVRHAPDALNAALDYGYAILLSMVTRDILVAGYNTSLGIHHASDQNCWNLPCDLMEPFRAAVDMTVAYNFKAVFNHEMKEHLWKLPDMKVNYRGKEQYLSNALRLYCQDILHSMDSDDGETFEVSFIADKILEDYAVLRSSDDHL